MSQELLEFIPWALNLIGYNIGHLEQTFHQIILYLFHVQNLINTNNVAQKTMDFQSKDQTQRLTEMLILIILIHFSTPQQKEQQKVNKNINQAHIQEKFIELQSYRAYKNMIQYNSKFGRRHTKKNKINLSKQNIPLTNTQKIIKNCNIFYYRFQQFQRRVFSSLALRFRLLGFKTAGRLLPFQPKNKHSQLPACQFIEIKTQSNAKNRYIKQHNLLYCRSKAGKGMEADQIDVLSLLNQCTKELSLFGSHQNQSLINILHHISSNFQFYQPEKQQILKFLKLHQYYFYKYRDIYDLCLQNMCLPLKRISQLMGYESFEKAVNRKFPLNRRRNNISKQQLIEQLLSIRKQELNLQKQTEIKLIVINTVCKQLKEQMQDIKREYTITKGNKTVTIKQFLNQSKVFLNQAPQIQSFIHKLQHIYQSEKSRNFQRKTVSQRFMSSVERQQLPDISCVGCSQFFYYNQNILESSFNKVPIIAISDSKQGLELKREIGESICALMNSNGGILLLDCEIGYLQTYVNGRQITQSQKKVLVQQISQILQDIRPVPLLDKQVIVEFVPLKLMKTQQQLRFEENSGEFGERPFIYGNYACRIKVRPLRKSGQLYVLNDQNGYKIMVLNQLQKAEILSKDLRKYLKKKFAKNQRFFQFADNFDHQLCAQPEKREKIHYRFGQNRNTSQQFISMVLLVCKPKHLPQIKSKLDALGLQYEIQTMFEQYKLKPAKYTAVLYYNNSWEWLLNNVCLSPHFQISGKALLTISITAYLKLENRNQETRISVQQYQNISNWLTVEFPLQRLKIWQYKSQDLSQFYFQTESRQSTLFIYYVLNHYEEKASLKDPKGLQRLSQIQRNEVWRQIKFDSL